MSDLVGNPEDRFSHNKAQISLFLCQSLTTIAELRDSVRFPYKAELDHAIGSAVKAMGPRLVLQAVPLQITGQR